MAPRVLWHNVLALTQLPFLTASPSPSPASPSLSCTPSSISLPPIPSISILSTTASPVTNFSTNVTQNGDISAATLSNLSFCNVTITYTHPGWNDSITTTTWLPLPLSAWNLRFLGTGGGGFSTGLGALSLAPAVAAGFAAADTDGGHLELQTSSRDWALTSEGNVNDYLLQDFASRSLHELAVLGKEVTKSFYGKEAQFAYWSGCSTGGRQGLMLAQRWPDDFDGILALAPAINWDSFLVAEYYPQLVMNQLRTYPASCELDAFTAAAITACDGLDGVQDGVISLPGECHFDPNSLVGESFDCAGTQTTFAKEAALVVEAAWNGARSSNGSFQWYGLNKDAPLEGPEDQTGTGLVSTTCKTPAGNCSGVPFSVSAEWISFFVEKSTTFDLTRISHEQFDRYLHLSRNEYNSIIGTSDPDLSFFKNAGGKMITWHGMADQLIFPNGTVDYYDRVIAGDPQAQDYYRFFEAPGTVHCMTGSGPYPDNALGALIDWVEKGNAPETLTAVGKTTNDTKVTRPLCMYPKVQTYVGGDPNLYSSFECR